MVQERNLHSDDADFMAEFPLYTQTKSFVSYILKNYTKNENQNCLDDLPKSIKYLWINLYEYGLVEIEDVQSVMLWLKVLSSIGYIFPGKVTSREKTEISLDHKRFLSKGKNLNEISKKYLTDKYNGMTYMTSTCIHNQAGKSSA